MTATPPSSTSKKLRFLAIGGLNTLIDFAVLYALLAATFPLFWSNVLSTTCAFVFSFLMNRKFTFRSKTNPLKQFAKFLIVTLFGLWALQGLVLWGVSLTATWLSVPTQYDWLVVFAGKVIATGVTLVWNFILYDRFVYRDATTRQ